MDYEYQKPLKSIINIRSQFPHVLVDLHVHQSIGAAICRLKAIRGHKHKKKSSFRRSIQAYVRINIIEEKRSI